MILPETALGLDDIFAATITLLMDMHIMSLKKGWDIFGKIIFI